MAWLGRVLASLAMVQRLEAHRLDELLQATLIHVDHTQIRLECQLTPGTQVAQRVLEGLDLNRDGLISDLESLAFSESFKGHLATSLDGTPLPLTIVDHRFPSLDELTNGTGALQIELEGNFPRLSPGTHHVFFENQHQTNLSVYLANALLPQSRSIEIARQSRDEFQRTSLIEFTVLDSPPSTHPHPVAPNTPTRWRWRLVAVIGLGIGITVWRSFRTGSSRQ
jgi:hypothetical protein